MLRHAIWTIVLSVFLALANSAGADWTVDLTTEFSGATPPAGSAPWLRASFADGTGLDAGDVFMHLEAMNLVGTEHVSAWYFNFDDAMSLDHLVVTREAGSHSWESFDPSENGLQADGDGKYDFALGWNNPSSGPNYFDSAGDVTFRLSSTTNESLDALDFMHLSQAAGGHGPFVTAAHVQGIGDRGTESGWVTGTATVIPVPGGVLLGLVGFAGIGFVRRRLL